MSYQTKLEQLEQKKAALQKSSPARDRLVALFDEGTFVELDAFAACGEEGVGVITGYGSVEGDVVYAFSQDVTTLGGAVSRAHAAKIAKLLDRAFDVRNGYAACVSRRKFMSGNTDTGQKRIAFFPSPGRPFQKSKIFFVNLLTAVKKVVFLPRFKKQAKKRKTTHHAGTLEKISTILRQTICSENLRSP